MEILVDVSERGGGADVSKRAEAQGLVMNKNMLPGDTSAVKPSGIRLGTPEMTRLGMGKDAMDEVAELIHLASISGHETEVRNRARRLKEEYNEMKYCWPSNHDAYAIPKWSEL